jgi:transcriptional regulator with XRE-family HTH domain
MANKYNNFIVNSNLLKIRKAIGLTQKEFSFMLRIKRSLLGAYEEQRAEVTTEVIASCLKRGWLLPAQMHDFMFLKRFKPTPTKKYEKVWTEQAVDEIKSSIKPKKKKS